MKARGGVEVLHYSIFNHDAGWGWVVSAMLWHLNAQERGLILIVQEAR
jgi:hypothetical protein